MLVGLKVPEFDLNLVPIASEANIEQALCLGFGFGGQNTMIALRKLKDY
ncbi:hypothetical protein RINTHH_9780 [Richelia intracellularis HH01]|uniref:Beta-ketoacyl-[acyl-carrier-protein] synthase I n=1 Tax=Richelia intracellularis HH01 TaxID=1165094 RepID=M1WZW7_9NOST|nr:hypothetical protein RINTHH_9780 [Richelia intracellularis HH01]